MDESPVSLFNGKVPCSGIDFTRQMALICYDMTQRVPELSHIDMRYVPVGFKQTRRDVSWGMYASLTPLRFENGERISIRHGKRCAIQQLVDKSGVEMLYILNFYLPRFFKLDFHCRLITTVHELWHISPTFNGDIRRLGGRCYVHSASQKDFDAKAESLADEWLSKLPNEEICECLHYSFDELQKRYGNLRGTTFKAPKIFPVPERYI